MTMAYLVLRGGDIPDRPLTEPEGNVLLCLAANGEASASELVEVIWPDPDTMPDGWADPLRKLVRNLRRYLKPHGYGIANRRGYGYRLQKIEDKA